VVRPVGVFAALRRAAFILAVARTPRKLRRLPAGPPPLEDDRGGEVDQGVEDGLAVGGGPLALDVEGVGFLLQPLAHGELAPNGKLTASGA